MSISKSAKDYKPADDYYTPRWVFESLKLEFDLDVCAPEQGVPWLPAKKHYHLELDGLAQPWEGLVWCNPPYSDPTPWIDKFLEHGNGIMLVQVSKSRAFMRLWEHSHTILMLPPNIKFEHRDEGTKGIFMPVALFGMGNTATGALVRSEIGRVR
jgi:hypothetical protein